MFQAGVLVLIFLMAMAIINMPIAAVKAQTIAPVTAFIVATWTKSPVASNSWNIAVCRARTAIMAWARLIFFAARRVKSSSFLVFAKLYIAIIIL